MATTVDIPDVGIVEFPDSMSQEEITSASSRLHAVNQQRVAKAAQLRTEMEAARAKGERLESLSTALANTESVVWGLANPIKNVFRAAEGATGKQVPEVVKQSLNFERPPADLQIPQIPQQQGGTAQVAAGAANAVIDFANFLITPEGVATLGIGELPKASQRALVGAFATSMATAAPQQVLEANKLAAQGDVQGAVKAATGAGGSALFSGLMAGHATAAEIAPLKDVKPKSDLSFTEKAAETAEQNNAPAAAQALKEVHGIETKGTTLPIEGKETPTKEAARPIQPVPEVAEATPRPELAPEQPPAESEVKIAQPGAAHEYVGMGGATPAEFQKAPGTPTSIKNATVDVEREQRGLPPAMAPARRTYGAVWDETVAAIDHDPGVQDRLIDELRAKPRALTDSEDAMLLHRQIDLQNEHGKALRDLAQARDDGRTLDVESENLRVQQLSDQLLDLYNIGKKVGTETGRGLAARRMMAYEDFSLAKMELEKRAANEGAPLTDAQRAEIQELHKRIEDTQKKYDDYVAKAEEEARQRAIEAAIAKAPAPDPYILQLAERIIGSLDKRADAARKRLRDKMARTSAGVDPTILADLAEIGASHIGHVGLDLVKWSARMIDDVGEWAREHLDDVFKRAQALIEADVAEKSEPSKSAGVKSRISKKDKESGDAFAAAIKDKLTAGKRNEIGPIVQKLARTFVELGITDRNELVDAVHAELLKQIPDITRRETMDAISGYGDFKPLTKDEISVQLRDLKGQLQQVAKLEDMGAGEAPKKTGIERRTPSDEERQLIKQVNELKKRGGFTVTDPAKQLKSALDAIKTRLQHQIADLSLQIANRRQTVPVRKSVQLDAEAAELKTRRDALKKEYDEIFGKRDISDEKRIEMATKAVERSIADYEKRISAGDISPRKPARATPSTPALEALKARRDALREELLNLRDSNAAYQEQKRIAEQTEQIAEAETRIDELIQQINEGDIATKKPAENPVLPELAKKRAEIDELNKLKSKLRSAAKAPTAAERQAKADAAIQQRIDELVRQINEGDIATKTSPKKAVPIETEALRAELAELNKIRQQLRNASKPKKSPDEIALQSLKTRLKNDTAKLMEKLAAGDFAPRKPKNVTLDSEATKLKFENEKAKRQYREGLLKDKLAKRSLGRKVFDRGVEAVNLARALMTSFDLSAVLRQGGFITFGHPIRALKIFPKMFRAMASEKGQYAVEQELLSRPNYPLYQRAGLYLSDATASLSKLEEAYMSRWAEKIPGVSHSQRAYTTFLNALRADSFDALAESVARKGTLTEAEGKAIANFVNVATGRGKIGLTDNAAVGLNTVFFAPKLVASRFQLLLGQPLYKGSAATRKLIAAEYARTLGGLAVVYALGTMAGGEVETDPTSSDFGKLRFGNTRVDPLMGLAQNTVLLSRLTTGEMTNLRGRTTAIRGNVPFGRPDAAEVISKFLRTKLAPVPSAAVNLTTGKNVVGEEVTPLSTLTDLTVPLSMRDIYNVMAEQGIPRGTIIELLSLLGMSVQHYED